MKKLSVLFAAVVMLFSVGVNAQKVASMDVAAILSVMPEKKKADEQMDAYQSAKQVELQKLAQAAQTKLQAWQEDAAKQTPEVNKKREAELQVMQDDIQKKEAAARKDVADKSTVTYAPIEAKFGAAVDKVAKANGWEFILDSSSPGLVYKNGPDATALVKKELGL